MTPTIVLGPDGRVRLVTGTPGGATIITTVAQMISNVIDFGMDASAATAAPRMHHQHLPDAIRVERNGMRPDVVVQLRSMGHDIQERQGHSGDTQSSQVLPDGSMIGVSDPRRGGSAIAVE
jgi:gamma-glutamyltranspeptidase/glutathione hydrolase